MARLHSRRARGGRDPARRALVASRAATGSRPRADVPRIATVLFDLGGVVCRFRPERRLAALAAECGLPEREVQARIWDSGFDRDCDQGRYTAAEMAAGLRARLGLPPGHAGLDRIWSLAFEPDPAVLALVDALGTRVRVGLLTDNGPILCEALPRHLPDVARRFDPRLFSCDLGALKPEPDLFAAVLDRLGQRPDAVLVVDDSPRVVGGAIMCGLRACLYRSAETLERDLEGYGLGPRPG